MGEYNANVKDIQIEYHAEYKIRQYLYYWRILYMNKYRNI